MNGDYHTDQDTESLFRLFDTAAAFEINELRSLLNHYRNKQTDCYRNGNHEQADEWEKKVAAVVAQLRERGQGEEVGNDS